MSPEIKGRSSSWTAPASLFSPSGERYGSGDYADCCFFVFFFLLLNLEKIDVSLILIAEAEFGR